MHKCTPVSIGVKEAVDFVLMFYMVHEVPDKRKLFNEVLPLVKKDGLVMIVEPGLISKKEFNGMVEFIKENGFEEYETLKIMFSKGIVLKNIKR